MVTVGSKLMKRIKDATTKHHTDLEKVKASLAATTDFKILHGTDMQQIDQDDLWAWNAYLEFAFNLFSSKDHKNDTCVAALAKTRRRAQIRLQKHELCQSGQGRKDGIKDNKELNFNLDLHNILSLTSFMRGRQCRRRSSPSKRLTPFQE